MSIAFTAMQFAREVHKDQRRRYTNSPYIEHRAEVAGIVATVVDWDMINPDILVATAWLHDCIEDQGITTLQLDRLLSQHGMTECEAVVRGVWQLSDTETGNRAERKAKARTRLAGAARWVQTIKCADLISNTKSIVEHDPKFSEVYVVEARLLLDVMERADPRLRELAYQQLCPPATQGATL